MGRHRDHPDKGGSYITGCGDADELVFMGQPIVRRNETVLRNCSGCCGETDGCPGVIICKFCITFTLTSSHLRSIPLFIVVTTCEVKCGSRVRVTFYPHPVLSWFYLKQFIISVLSIRFYLILSYTIDVNALYNRCLSLVILLISPNVF